MTDVADTGPWIGPRLRVLPILLVLVLGVVIVILSFSITALAKHALGPGAYWPDWLNITITEAFELLFALAGIAAARRFLPSADFALRWPQGRTYIGWGAFWGILFGLIMLVADHWPQLIAIRPPMVPETPTPANIAGWLAFELLLVGIAEETLFRGLLLGVLTALSPSRIRIRRFEISTAGVTLAVLFALAHASNFATRPWYEALAQQFYAIALGIIYAWLREQSKSVVPAIVAHSLSDTVETGLEFLLNAVL